MSPGYRIEYRWILMGPLLGPYVAAAGLGAVVATRTARIDMPRADVS